MINSDTQSESEAGLQISDVSCEGSCQEHVQTFEGRAAARVTNTTRRV